MFESHTVTSLDRTSFDFLFEEFFEQSAFVNNHLLCSLISSSQFLLFWGRWAARWTLSKNCARWNFSTPIYVECDKMYWSKVCLQEFWNFVSGLDIQSEQSENNNPALKKSSCRLLNTGSNIPFFSIIWYEPVAQWLRQAALNQEAWVWLSQGTEILCCLLAIVRGTEPVSALTQAFYIAVLSIIFFSWILSVANSL